jgi:cytochrome c oxidase subunit IV
MSNNQQHHIVSAKTYTLVFIALLFLTVITVAAAQIDFGPLNLTIAMLIAVVKATLVALVFMGLRWDSGMARVAMIVSIGCLFLFILFTVLDFTTRANMDPLENGRHSLKTPVTVVKPGSVHGANESSQGSKH